MTTRPLERPNARLLNHCEFVYAPGDRARVRLLFEGLGFRVLDPQTDPTPAHLGPAAGPYLIVYLDEAWNRRRQQATVEGRPATVTELFDAVVEGAVQRVRPKVMTVSTTILALLPIMWASTMGTGAGVTKRIALSQG